MSSKENKPSHTFQQLFYAQCWEDPLLHEASMKLNTEDVVLGIASAGDNVFHHLTADVKKVIAIDFNPVQLMVCRLKMEAIRQLESTEVAGFLGCHTFSDRTQIFNDKLLAFLPVNDQLFWKDKSAWIESGIIHCGKFDRYFQKFQKYVMPFTQSVKTRRALFEKRNRAEREEFFQKKWDNPAWRLLFKLFFSRRLMAMLGRSSDHFAQVEDIDITKLFYERARHAMVNLDPSENPFLQYMILSKYTMEQVLPEYLKPENLELIKPRLHRVQLVCDSLEGFLATFSGPPINAWNLSNIFEYMDLDSFRNLTGQIIANAAAGARFSYWNLLVNRRMSEIEPKKLVYHESLSNSLWNRDRAFVYKKYIAETLRT